MSLVSREYYRAFLCLLIMLLPFVYFCSFNTLNIDDGTVYATTANSGFTIHQSSSSDIQIQYPTDWIKVDGPMLDRMKANNSIPIVGFCPEDFSVMLVVTKEKLLKNNTIDEEVNDGIRLLEKNQPDFKLIGSNKTTLAGLPAHSLLYSGTFDPAAALKRFPELAETVGQMFEIKPVNSTTLEYATIRDGYTYILAYSDMTGNFLKQQSNNPLIASLNSSPCSALSSQSPGIEDLGGLFGSTPNSSPLKSLNITNPFPHYLPLAQKMIKSFSFTTSNETVGPEVASLTDNQSVREKIADPAASEDPITILKKRLANGDISVDEYNKLLKIITSD